MMTENNDTRRYSLDELKAIRQQGKTETRADAPAYPVEDAFWNHARITMPHDQPKIHTGIRLDADLLTWFKGQGRGWQTRMNAVLRSYYETHTDRPS